MENQSKIAQESEKTRRARKKLSSRYQEIEKQVTDQALRRKVHEMKIWLNKYAMERAVIKDSKSADFTKKVHAIIHQLEKDAHE